MTLLNPFPCTDPFFTTGEQEEFVAGCLQYELLKLSEKHDLPTKYAGATDIYINERDGRNHPKALGFFADHYANALRRLKVQRFGEIPQAITCYAGPVAERLGIPMYTVREEEKTGRATSGLIIGKVIVGERNALMDDVITTGGSAIPAYWALVNRGVHPYLVVMVDRQQGWQENFAEHGVNMPVWAGMTLDDMRYHLVDTFGVLSRCSPEKEALNPIILALDGRPWDKLLPILSRIRMSGCILKINNLLHSQTHKNIVRRLGIYGRVMVDFKGHDTPKTVGNICREYRNDAPWAVTIHGSGGEEMILEAIKAFEGTPTKVLVVTVLTSIDPITCDEIYHCLPIDEVKSLAAIGARAGCDGFVCSGEEVEVLSELYPGKEFVVPGVRSPGVGKGDQRRVVTPAEAMGRGATKIAGGEQFLNALDPVAEIGRVVKDELLITL